MKEAIRIVPESIYDSEDTSHFRSGRGCHSALRRIKEEWRASHWFLAFDIRKCFHTIDRHRLIPIFKEEIDDPKFFYTIQKVFSTIRGEKDFDSVPYSVLLSALPGNIYLHKLDQEIERIQQKYEIPIVQEMRLLRTGHQENSGEEERHYSVRAPQDKSITERRLKRKAAFHSLLSSWHTHPTSTPGLSGGPKSSRFPHNKPSCAPLVFLSTSLTSFSSPPLSSLASFLNKTVSLLCDSFLVEAVGLSSRKKCYLSSREPCHNNWAMKGTSCKRKALLIELGRKAVLVIRSEKGLDHKPAPIKSHYLIKISYARYADDSLLGITGAVELLIEIEKGIAHFLQSGLNLGSAGSTTIAAQSAVEFLGMVLREVPPKKSPIKFLRELEKRLRVKHRIRITACHLREAIHSKFRNLGQTIPIKQLTKRMSGTESLLHAVQLAETLRTAGVKSAQVNVLKGTLKHIQQGSNDFSLLHRLGRDNVLSDVQEAVSESGMSARKLSLYTLARQKEGGKVGGHWEGSSSKEFPIKVIKVEAPIKKILRRLRERGIISRRRLWPIHVTRLTNVSDRDIVNWYAGIAINLLAYYRGCDNLSQVRTIVDHQIRWSAIFTPVHKHKSSAKKIILKYSKDLNIVNQEGSKNLAEFPNSIELKKLGPGK